MNESIKKLILSIFEENDAARSVFDLAERTHTDVGELQRQLNELCAEGKLAVTKKGKYALPETLGLILAKASALRNGSPTALPTNGGSVMRVRALGRLCCLPDDLLLVRPVGDGECELVCIARRGKPELPAFLRVRRSSGGRRKGRHGRELPPEEPRIWITATACDRRIPYPISVNSDLPVENDQIALLHIDRYPEGDQPMLAHVVRILGDSSDMLARLKVIAENHGFSTEAPPKIEAPTESSPREDLRERLTMTIDGPFSKDFDDAVSLEKNASGDWLLGVHIADVSHFVRPGSPVDADALERGSSLYLPGLTVPMLPEALSNDLCSLLPGEDRLALSLFMTVRDGKVIDHRLTRAIICSHARLTYDAVNRFFDGTADAVPEEVRSALLDMRALARELRARRMRAGCLDLDLPETEFTLDEFLIPTDVFCAERGESERLIEDFMLAANETVALLAKSTDTPLVYRIHESPDGDRLRDLTAELSLLSIPAKLSANPQPGELQAILERVKEHPAADSIRRLVLRSLQRARYSDQPDGHYALALRDYCHFTSPIRRYPDLAVHRMLKRMMDGKSTDGFSERMAAIAAQSTAREQEATLAEREADALMKARHMEDHIGQRFDGVISGVTGWGLYVTLPNTVEGLVPISSLDDYYEFDKERRQLVSTGTRNVFRMGDRVRVRVEYVDLDRSEIDFKLVPQSRIHH